MMKKLVSILMAVALFTLATVPAMAAKVDPLDGAIREASNYLNTKIPSGSLVAFINISGGYPDLSDYVLSELARNGVNDGKFSVVNRGQLEAVRAELNFNTSGEVSDTSAQEIGQMLGAKTIVTGGVRKIGANFRFEVKAIEVQTAKVQGDWSSKNIANKNNIADLTKRTGPTGATTAAAPRAPATQTAQATPAAPAAPAEPAAPPEPEHPAYKIGDTGPAGGLIFYDKGNNNGGWRYLEAAPVQGEFSGIKWSVHSTPVAGTGEPIGSGQRNTQLIVEKFRETSGEWDNAAQKADDLVLNGFDNWFLPSKAELDQMYGNLKRRNLGEFKNERYWSSSEYSDHKDYAHVQNFSDGKMDRTFKTYTYYVRPIRQVPGPAR